MSVRASAPPYVGEGPHALWHVSEDRDLDVMAPHVPATNPTAEPSVWAVDTRHLPLYWFPRDCPRGCIWPTSATTAADHEHLIGDGAVARVHAMERSWLETMRATTLFLHELPSATFVPDGEVGGYWRSDVPVRVQRTTPLADPVAAHERAGIGLLVVDDLAAWWSDVVASTVEFSGIRLRNIGGGPT